MSASARRERAVGWGIAGSPTMALLAAPLALLFVVPVVVLLWRTTPAAVVEQLQDRETLAAIGLSFVTTLAALGTIVVLGTPLAYWLARGRSSDGTRHEAGIARRIVDVIVDLPMLMPPAVAGLALLMTLGRRGPVGSVLEQMGVTLAFSSAAVVIAQVFVSAPFYVRSAKAGFEAIDPDLLDAARLDGASAWATLRRVVWPRAWPAIAAGAAMAWARALGEFGATIIFAGSMPGRTQTMPLAVYVGFETSLERAVVLSTVMITLAVAALVLVRLIAGRQS